jgi:hypothetical protein
LDVPGLPRTGPESFWVDAQGHVYISDTANLRVVHLSNSGIIDTVQLGYTCNDIAVDGAGNLFVLEWSTGVVHYMSPTGFETQATRIDPQLMAGFSRLGVTDDHPVLITAEQIEYSLSTFEELAPLSLSMDRAPEALGLSGWSNVRVLVSNTALGRAEVSIVQGATAPLGVSSASASSVLLPARNVASVAFVGQDTVGNLYIQVECFWPSTGRIDLKLYCIDPRGQSELLIDNMPNEYWLWTAKLLQVNEQGDVYQLLPTPTGVYINVWERAEGE